MTEETENHSEAARTPPYISFSSFQTMLEDFKTNGIPPRVDRSVLTRFAGGLAGQLIMALKSLGLTNEKNEPTDRGRALISAFGTEAYKERLSEVLERSYPFLSSLDLKVATPSMFAEAFKTGTNAKEDVLRKCRTFYLQAAQTAGVPLGSRLQTGRVGRSAGQPVRRKPKANRTKAPEQAAEPIAGGTPQSGGPTETVAAKLLNKFPEFDPAWPPEIQAKWFEGYGKLLAMNEKA